MDRRGRFAAAIVGAAIASLVWTVLVVTFSTTPEDARKQRSAPSSPPASVVLREQKLRQVAWYDCSRAGIALPVQAPPVSDGDRSVVTFVARAGAKATTGTVLARVADQKLIAVATDAIFYRDLKVGVRGDDVEGLEQALVRVGAIGRADDVLDTATTLAWKSRIDNSAAVDRISLSSLVGVPDAAAVGTVMVKRGQVAKPGVDLLDVVAVSRDFRCEVPDPSERITPSNVALEVEGRAVEVLEITATKQSPNNPGSVLVSTSKSAETDENARLGVVEAQSDGPVLAAPLSAVKTDAGGTKVVVVLRGKTRKTMPVTLGVSAQGLVELKGRGLRDGAELLLFDQSSPPTGMSPDATEAP